MLKVYFRPKPLGMRQTGFEYEIKPNITETLSGMQYPSSTDTLEGIRVARDSVSANRVERVEVTGEERLWILTTFVNLPYAKDTTKTVYTGEMAQFIVNNL